MRSLTPFSFFAHLHSPHANMLLNISACCVLRCSGICHHGTVGHLHFNSDGCSKGGMDVLRPALAIDDCGASSSALAICVWARDPSFSACSAFNASADRSWIYLSEALLVST